jgi:hypothetical protein
LTFRSGVILIRKNAIYIAAVDDNAYHNSMPDVGRESVQTFVKAFKALLLRSKGVRVPAQRLIW